MLQRAASPLSTIETWLQVWFAERGFALDREQNYYDAGAIDSLGVIELIEDIEMRLGVTWGERDFQDRRFSTIAGLAEIVDERLHPR